MNEFYESLTPEERDIYSEIADFAGSLGYKPKKAKTKGVSYVFTHPKTKKHILKMTYEKERPHIKLKFYASTSYPPLFHEAVRRTIEEFDYKYTGCYGCGRCDGTVGYSYAYPDGRTYFRCNGEVIDIGSITRSDMADIMALLKAQHEYYLSKNESDSEQA